MIILSLMIDQNGGDWIPVRANPWELKAGQVGCEATRMTNAAWSAPSTCGLNSDGGSSRWAGTNLYPVSRGDRYCGLARLTGRPKRTTRALIVDSGPTARGVYCLKIVSVSAWSPDYITA